MSGAGAVRRAEDESDRAVLIALLALTGCAQGLTGQAQTPNAPNSPENRGVMPEHGGGDSGSGM